jgi:hypothetical protein
LFNIPHRDVLDAEIIALPAPTLPLGEVSKNDQNDKLTSDNIEFNEQLPIDNEN